MKVVIEEGSKKNKALPSLWAHDNTILLDLKDGRQMVLRHTSYPVGHIDKWNISHPSWTPFEGTITLSNDE